MLSKKYLRRKFTGECDHTMPLERDESGLGLVSGIGPNCKKPGRRYYPGELSNGDVWFCDDHAESRPERD